MLKFWSRIKIRGKLLVGFGLIGLIFVVSSVYTLTQITISNTTTRTIAETNAPAWDAAMEVKVGLITGHLWLEEALAGDETIRKAKIFNSFEDARWHVEALMKGAEKEGVTYTALKDAEIRKVLTSTSEDLDEFIDMANRRYEAFAGGKSTASASGTLDMEFDNMFEGLMKDLTALEVSIAAMVSADNALIQDIYESQYSRVVIAIVLMVVISILIAMVFSEHVVARPIRDITAFLKGVSEGRLTETMEVHSADELGDMAGAVNAMVDRLSGLVSQVQRAGIQVASSVTEIAASIKEQEATATEHAATTSEVAASVQEIAATSKDLGKTTEEVNSLTQDTAASAADGQALIAELDTTMARMSEASNAIAGKLAVLSEKTGKISGMVTTINKVAEQTNLLSLNAAIEAEKAGEYGRGFSVVATEIRRLADQTAVSTFDIEQMVAEVQSAVSAGVMSMDKFSEEINRSVADAKKAGERLEMIVEQVQALAPHVESVNEGLQAQNDGASQINEAMMNLSEAAQQTADFVRQSNNAIVELNNAARGLRDGVSIFKLKSA